MCNVYECADDIVVGRILITTISYTLHMHMYKQPLFIKWNNSKPKYNSRNNR